MARTGDGSADYFLDSSISTFSVAPCSMFCWFRMDVTGTTMTPMHCVDAGTGAWSGLWFQKDSSENLFARARANSSSVTVSATIGTSLSANTWYALGMTKVNTTSLDYRVNGWLDGSKATDTQTLLAHPLAREELAILSLYNNAASNYVDGAMAHCAGWNVELSDGEMEALAKGYSPKRIRPQSLAFYCPMLETANTANALDMKGNMALTATSNPGLAADHPPVIHTL